MSEQFKQVGEFYQSIISFIHDEQTIFNMHAY